MTEWHGEERRSNPSSLDSIKLCMVEAFKEFKKEEKVEEIERFRLHQAECPAFQSSKAMKWLIGLPVISTIIVLVHYYFLKK